MKTPNNKSKQNDELKAKDKQLNVSVESKAVKKKPKSKKPKAITEAVKKTVAVEAKEGAKTLTAADLAKIEKKKAKKQAQKVKKQLRKSTGATEEKKPAVETKIVAKADKKGKAASVGEEKAAKKNRDTKQKAKPKRKGNNKDEDIERRERDPAVEAATVFVGNLPVNTKRVQINRLFQPYGTVQTIRLRTAGGKQLFKHKQRKAAGSLNAYVVLESAEIAQKALALNGVEFKEFHLRVTPADKASFAAGATNAEQAVSDADSKRTVFVGNLKYSANEQKLREIFSSCGEIDYIRCLHDGEKGCKGVAYVCFQKPDAVGLALELNETVLDDRPIHVERYAVKKLGAKQARDSAAAKTAGSNSSKSKTKLNSAGAKKRLDKKKVKENGKPTEAGPKKKSEYRGVKVDSTKKNKKPKKKGNNQLTALAKKIAPKTKT